MTDYICTAALSEQVIADGIGHGHGVVVFAVQFLEDLSVAGRISRGSCDQQQYVRRDSNSYLIVKEQRKE